MKLPAYKLIPCIILSAMMNLPLTSASEKPNVVLILADDLGMECLSAFGGESYHTPNLDQLAKQGMKFDHCFAAPYCTPSRAQILTGNYPFKNGIKGLIYKEHQKTKLSPTENPSFSATFQRHGYRTFIAGKWQLSILKNYDTIKDFGFDSYRCWQIFDAQRNKTNRHYQYTYRTNGVAQKEFQPKRYGPDAMCDFLIQEIKQSHQNKQPFMAYYTSLLPHWPWVPTPDSKDQKMPSGRLGNKKFLGDMITYLDKNVGRLLDTLDELGIRDNTIVMFVADNGTDQNGILSRWNGKTVKGAKGALNDRGTRVPLIVRWPAKVAAGSSCSDLIDISDIFPTLCSCAGLEPGNDLHGQSFFPQLEGRPGVPRSWVFMQNEAGYYIRDKNWIIDSKGKVRPTARLDLTPAPVQNKFSEPQKKQISELRKELKNLLKK